VVSDRIEGTWVEKVKGESSGGGTQGLLMEKIVTEEELGGKREGKGEKRP
jgi:hypothetical protein